MLSIICIDSREPDWVQKLSFGGTPKSILALQTGDILAGCDDGQTLLIERKTPNDFLNTLKENRLFDQVSRLAECRKENNYWPYLLVTDYFSYSRSGCVVIDKKVTGWEFSAVWGALLSIQELGVPVIFCAGDNDLEATVIRLSKRNRKSTVLYEPKRIATGLNDAEKIISSLPGIGIEKTPIILQHCGSVGKALEMMTDVKSFVPGVGPGLRKRVRQTLGLNQNEKLLIENLDRGKNE